MGSRKGLTIKTPFDSLTAMNDKEKQSLVCCVNYLLATEKKSYEEHIENWGDKLKHIYHHVQTLEKFVKKQKI